MAVIGLMWLATVWSVWLPTTLMPATAVRRVAHWLAWQLILALAGAGLAWMAAAWGMWLLRLAPVVRVYLNCPWLRQVRKGCPEG